MQLYGVIHGGETTFGGLRLMKWHVDPAPEILDAIRALPEGSSVGIESIREFHESGDTMGLHLEDEDLWFWEDIITETKSIGHNLCYLDGLSLHSKAAKKLSDLGIVRGMLTGQSNYEIVPGRERDVEELEFALEAAWTHVFEIEREDAIIEALKKQKPDLAVIGLAHADFVALDPLLLNRLGITSYVRAITPEISRRFSSFIDHAFMRQIIGPPEPDPSVLSAREVTIRNYLAATKARITVGQEPTWVGSWNPSCRPSGLFEVHVDEQNGDISSGTIEDSLGTATFSGELGRKSLHLIKEYDPKQTLVPNYIEGGIVYEAKATDDGLYVGSWYSAVQPNINGELVMLQSNKLFDPPPIEP